MDVGVIITYPRTFFPDGSFRIWISVSGPYDPNFSFSKQNPLLDYYVGTVVTIAGIAGTTTSLVASR